MTGSRTTLESLLMSRSLNDAELMQVSDKAPDYAILPDVSVIKIGGQSLIDRGRTAVYPLVEELVAVKRSHQILIGTGAGTRARHVYSLAAELGLPTGVLTDVGAAVADQNARMLGYLMARHGVPVVDGSAFGAIPLYLAECGAAIFSGMPPYDMWQHVPSEGVIPPYRTDTGAFLLADAYGAARTIYVKDVDGVFISDPATADGSPPELIPRVRAAELLAMNLDVLPIDALVLELMAHAKHQKEIQIINGLTPGNITKALRGEHVGTVIHAD